MKRNQAWFLITLVMLPLLVYLPTLKHELIWDAKPMIMENELLQGEFSPLAPFRSGYWASTSQKGSGYDYYRPLMVLSFMAEKAVWGLDPLRLRWLNLFIFIAGLVVLYFFLSRQTDVNGLAETAALLFALYPLNLDNITWVVGRCDLLMLFFGLLALYLFDLFLARKNILFAVIATASYLLALFSKEAAVFFLPLFILHELVRRKRLTFSLHAATFIVTMMYWGLKSAVIGRGGIPIHFFSGIWENGRILLGVLGYYLRSLVFPFRYDMFLPVDAMQTWPYIVPGFLFVFILFLLLWLGRKKKQYLQAWIWIAPFLGGHLLMVFTPIYPFSVSTRYLLLPAIGLAWMLAHFLRMLPKPRGTIILAMLLFAQAAAIIGNASKYQRETIFWAGAVRSCPHDSFFLSQYAGQLIADGDLIGAEINLRRALRFSMKNSTAAAIALHLAEINRRQARYAESLDWLGRVRSLSLDRTQTSYRLNQFLKIHRALGNLAAAETIVQMLKSPARPVHDIRLELYLAFADWEKARTQVRTLAGPEAGVQSAQIEKIESAFLSSPPREQALYFANQGNFAYAWKLWPKESPLPFAEQAQLARLAFLAGQEADGKIRVEALAQKGKNDFRILNTLGNIFFDLQRADEALHFYQRSRQLKPDQPALLERLKLVDRKNNSTPAEQI